MARYDRSFAGERRTAFLGIQLTPSERAELDAAAEMHGAGVSTFARELLFQRGATVVASTRRNPEAASLSRELNALGNNLNQIARHQNMTGELRPDEQERLAAVIERLELAIAKVIEL